MSLENITNGGINYTIDKIPDFDLDTNATYFCNYGYSLNGTEAVRTCKKDNQEDTVGYWSGNPPLCHGMILITLQ